MFKPIQKENLMNKSLPILTLWVFIAVVMFATAFGALVVQGGTGSSGSAERGCLRSGPRQIPQRSGRCRLHRQQPLLRCRPVSNLQRCRLGLMGRSEPIGQNQKVETVYLYPNKIAGFGAYTGKLPLGLSARDTMAGVEDRFGQPKVEHAPQAGWQPGLPDESGTPDHIHYWAIYKRFGVTIIYNSPSAMDKGASIYAILVSK
jgi:hypothetical protein